VKERLDRKKYMGVWRWESELTVRMMSRFPKIVTRYMNRNRLKRKGCIAGSAVNHRRRNSETTVCFLASMLSSKLMKKME
jgi:hypothetical protein